MFRSEETTAKQFLSKFDELKQGLNKLEEIRLDSEFLRETKSYIDRLYNDTLDIEEKAFQNIKSAEMSNLNRLQKLKKRGSCRKDKHRNESKNQDWG